MTRAVLVLALGALAFAGAVSGDRAPSIRSAHWLNSPALTDADLRGKVRLVEFWTFDCINCLNTVPAMRKFHELFKDKGVVLIGVHTPEFDRERDPENVRQAVQRLKIEYPVATDNDYAIWKSFGNRYWPALYLIDRKGSIRWTHFGELHESTDDWNELNGKVQALLAE